MCVAAIGFSTLLRCDVIEGGSEQRGLRCSWFSALSTAKRCNSGGERYKLNDAIKLQTHSNASIQN